MCYCTKWCLKTRRQYCSRSTLLLAQSSGANEYNDFYSYADTVVQKSFDNYLNTIEKSQNKELSLHPNPNTGIFTLTTNFDPQEVVSVKVFSPVGLSVYQQAGLPSNTIQLPAGTKGLFWVEVVTQNQKFIRKMVVN